MRALLAITAFLFTSVGGHSQTNSATTVKWDRHDLDSTLSIVLPGRALKYDTISGGYRIKRLVGEQENVSVIAQRMLIDDSSEKYSGKLPSDSAELAILYAEMVKGVTQSLLDQGLMEPDSVYPVQRNGLIGRRIVMDFNGTNQLGMAVDIFVYRNYNYSITYVNRGGLSSSDLEWASEQTIFSNAEPWEQTMGPSTAFKWGYRMGGVILVVLVVIVVVVARSLRQLPK